MERLTELELQASLFLRASTGNDTAMTMFSCSTVTPLYQQHYRTYYSYPKIVCVMCGSVYKFTSSYLFTATCQVCDTHVQQYSNVGRHADMCNWTAYKFTTEQHQALLNVLKTYNGGNHEPV